MSLSCVTPSMLLGKKKELVSVSESQVILLIQHHQSQQQNKQLNGHTVHKLFMNRL